MPPLIWNREGISTLCPTAAHASGLEECQHADNQCTTPECCVDIDCGGNHPTFSECQNYNTCSNPDCCSDNDCNPNDYYNNSNCISGCNEDSHCNADIAYAVCGTEHQYTSPQCCSDTNCAPDEYCNVDTCLSGCNVVTDCYSRMSCAVFGSDNQCSTPECCFNTDCGANHLSCSECKADNTCSNPECCFDDDCANCSDTPYCDDYMFISGCNANSDCENYDHNFVYEDSYTKEESTFFYWYENTNGKLGSLIDNSNCAEPQPECTDNHRCGSATVLEFIQIYAESCVGCVGGNHEKGETLRLHGKYPTTEWATEKCIRRNKGNFTLMSIETR